MKRNSAKSASEFVSRWSSYIHDDNGDGDDDYDDDDDDDDGDDDDNSW